MGVPAASGQPGPDRGGTAQGQAGPLLAIFAHPDDEAFGCAGTFAIARNLSVPLTLITATRGEAGEISNPALATPENLGQVREQELRQAMAQVGVGDVRFLDYRDSGMAGTPENSNPRALMQAPEAEVASRLAELIRATRPQTVITFGPEGIYGHPDHVAIHHATVAAVRLAADPDATTAAVPWRIWGLYYTAAPRERLLAMAARRDDGPFRDLSDEELARMGTPEAEITTVIDVVPYLPEKRAALLAHRTQMGEGGPLEGLTRDEISAYLGREHFVRAPLPWQDPAALPRDLLDELASATPRP